MFKHLRASETYCTEYVMQILQCLDLQNSFACFFQVGDLQRSYAAAKKSEEAFPGHVDTQQLIKELKQHFAVL